MNAGQTLASLLCCTLCMAGCVSLYDADQGKPAGMAAWEQEGWATLVPTATTPAEIQRKIDAPPDQIFGAVIAACSNGTRRVLAQDRSSHLVVYRTLGGAGVAPLYVNVVILPTANGQAGNVRVTPAIRQPIEVQREGYSYTYWAFLPYDSVREQDALLNAVQQSAAGR